MKLTLSFLLLCSLATVAYSACTDTLNGIAIDTATSTIYFAQNCGTVDPANEQFGNDTFKSVSTSGGAITDIQTRVHVPAQGNIEIVQQYFEDELYFTTFLREPTNPVRALNVTSLEETSANVFASTRGFFIAAYNGNIQTYVGSQNGINRFDGLPTASSTGTTIYSPFQDGYYIYIIRKDRLVDTGLYWVENATDLMVGDESVSGLNPRRILDAAPESEIVDFDVISSGTVFIYATLSGHLFSYNATSAVTTLLATEDVTGLQVFNDRIYYNNGTAIKSIALDGTGVVVLTNGEPEDTGAVGDVTSAPSASTSAPSSPASNATSNACSATASIDARAGATWTDGSSKFEIFDITVVNTGSCAVVSGSLPVSFASKVTQQWNFDAPTGAISGFGAGVQASQAYLGSGFVLDVTSGIPTNTATAFTYSCDSSCGSSGSGSGSGSGSAPSLTCTGSVSIEARTGDSGSWTSGGVQYQIYDVSVINSGQKALSAVSLSITAANNSTIDQQNIWNLATTDGVNYSFALFGSTLAPGASYLQTAGFVVGGGGSPSFTASFSC